ncbi:beta-ketoacyl-[acyl-carrier-protein] synthase family protein [Flexivirga meconopsidis]|uniref:beta-ketoacyl-[acyl-carrier-protein] synthase family protein n=1 Tax=Flexivirga meconopsidis TaxID=2977121 RepID=UPI00223FF900|nr:beta-ketoacyl-[acyl-carrier-protein] synthase family protein [Flexivirga meconopsidis]
MTAPVVFTGRGVVSPAGCGVNAFWDALLAARSAAAPIDRFDATRHRVRIGCQVPSLEAPNGVDSKAFRRSDLFTQYALSAAREAIDDAGIGAMRGSRVGIVVGNAVGGRTTSDKESVKFAERGAGGVSPLMPLLTMPNAAAANIAMSFGWTGPAYTVATTCASGLDALGLARALLRADVVDVVLAGGCEATISPVTIAAFGTLDALSTRNDAPAAACRPFDVDRDGFVMGEGAAFVVLEREADAISRGATVHGRLLGYAATSDAHHLTAPHPQSLGAIDAMRGALRDAGCATTDIGHVNAHGTSTKLNDAAEARALRGVFGDAAVPPVTATKGVTGHMLGASGTAEVIASLSALAAGRVPPVANHATTDAELGLDVVHDTPRQVRRAPVLSNSFGFGGHNASVVVG